MTTCIHQENLPFLYLLAAAHDIVLFEDIQSIGPVHFGDLEECFQIFLRELYNVTTSESLIVTEEVVC